MAGMASWQHASLEGADGTRTQQFLGNLRSAVEARKLESYPKVKQKHLSFPRLAEDWYDLGSIWMERIALVRVAGSFVHVRRAAMLPERLSLAFALIAAMSLLYVGFIHRWGLETIFIAVLFAIFCSVFIGRIIGIVSARELAKNIEHTQAKLKRNAEEAAE